MQAQCQGQRSKRAEVADKTTALGVELKAANFHILKLAGRRKPQKWNWISKGVRYNLLNWI
jgi:hypothetical protein